MRGPQRIGQNIKESADALAHEHHPALVAVRLHSVVHAGLSKCLFQAQRLLQALGDVDELHLAIFEKLRLAAHDSSIERSVVDRMAHATIVRDYRLMENEKDDLLTGAAKAIGTAIGKVSTTLHLRETPAAAPLSAGTYAKVPPAKKKAARKKTAGRKTASKKAAAKRRK